jgi:pimeloyl-ACP methyl ester carboxylesterase
MAHVDHAWLAALRFARGWQRGVAGPLPGVTERVFRLPTGGRALRVEPARGGELPGWVALHGLTVPGLDHASLRRFARAVAASGARVLVPEIPAWTRLRFAPEEVRRCTLDAVAFLAEAPGVAPGGVRLAGFSFGGPRALALAGDPELAPRLRAVLAWGSYAELASALRFGFTGEFCTRRGLERLAPDPYGRWIAGANLLPADDPVAGALHRLALHAGRTGLEAASAEVAAAAVEIRSALGPAERGRFDAFVFPPEAPPDEETVTRLVDALVAAAREQVPALDPAAGLGPLAVPVHLLHGREDRLVPWTESERLAARLAPLAPAVHLTVTGLFAHSGDGGRLRAVEGVRFLRALARLLGS